MPFDFRLRDLMCPEKETYRPLLNFDNLVKRGEAEGYHKVQQDLRLSPYGARVPEPDGHFP